MKRVGDRWQTHLELEPGTHQYKFWVDGQWILDPRNSATRTTDDGHTNSCLTVMPPPLTRLRHIRAPIPAPGSGVPRPGARLKREAPGPGLPSRTELADTAS